MVAKQDIKTIHTLEVSKAGYRSKYNTRLYQNQNRCSELGTHTHTSVVPATQEAEAGESLELRRPVGAAQ